MNMTAVRNYYTESEISGAAHEWEKFQCRCFSASDPPCDPRLRARLDPRPPPRLLMTVGIIALIIFASLTGAASVT